MKLFLSRRSIAHLTCVYSAILFMIDPNQSSAATSLDSNRIGNVWKKLEAASLSVCRRYSSVQESHPCGGKMPTITTGYGAWTWNGRITVGSKLLNSTNDDELAFVLAHEMSHNIFQHVGGNREDELQADYWATRISMRAGYQPKAAKNVFKHGDLGRIINFPFSMLVYPSTSRRMREIQSASDDENKYRYTSVAVR